MEYVIEKTRKGWTVFRKVTLSSTQSTSTEVASYVYESDAQHIADILNDYSTGEAGA